MANKEMLVVEKELLRMVINGNVQFCFKIIMHPQIMVSDKKMDLDPAITEFCQFSQGSNESFWDHGFIFKPKIKKIAEQENCLGIVFYAVQPFNENLFTRNAFSIHWRAKMIVTGEVDFFAFRNLHWTKIVKVGYCIRNFHPT